MRISTQLQYDGDPKAAADSVVALEKAGLDTVWVAEVYGFDSPTLMGYLAARTERVKIASGILPLYSRTPSLIAMREGVRLYRGRMPEAIFTRSVRAARYPMSVGLSNP